MHMAFESVPGLVLCMETGVCGRAGPGFGWTLEVCSCLHSHLLSPFSESHGAVEFLGVFLALSCVLMPELRPLWPLLTLPWATCVF